MVFLIFCIQKKPPQDLSSAKDSVKEHVSALIHPSHLDKDVKDWLDEHKCYVSKYST